MEALNDIHILAPNALQWSGLMLTIFELSLLMRGQGMIERRSDLVTKILACTESKDFHRNDSHYEKPSRQNAHHLAAVSSWLIVGLVDLVAPSYTFQLAQLVPGRVQP
jgi:hypothetical protein